MIRGLGWCGVMLAFLVAGCASLASVSSGQVGCAESDITISDDDVGWSTRTWTAECHGKKYFCSAHGGGEHSTAQVSCKEATGEKSAPAATPAPAPKAAAPAGCQYDTQCKGDRLCINDACVEPKAPVSEPAAAGGTSTGAAAK